MKNYIDSEQHWMDSVNADHDRIEQMNKDMEKQINAQNEAQIQGQNLPIADVVLSEERAEYCECAAPVENVDKGCFRCTECKYEWHEQN